MNDETQGSWLRAGVHGVVIGIEVRAGERVAMGLEGAVRLGFRKELDAAARRGGAHARQRLFDELLAQAVQCGEALEMAAHLEIDDVVDPAQTRARLARLLVAACAAPPAPRRPFAGVWQGRPRAPTMPA